MNDKINTMASAEAKAVLLRHLVNLSIALLATGHYTHTPTGNDDGLAVVDETEGAPNRVSQAAESILTDLILCAEALAKFQSMGQTN
jgi:hypothetical protein